MTEPCDQSTDQELIDRLNAGDTAAFGQLYHRYRDWVVRLAYRFTGHHDDSLDVLQDTFAYVLSKFPGFELRSAMTSFLYPAVRNLAIAARRKRQKSLGNTGPSGTTEENICVEDLCAGQSHTGNDEEFSRLLSSLSPAHREIVLMRIVDDMALKEIAQALQISEGTAKSRWHYAMRALKESPEIQQLLRDSHADDGPT